MISRTKMAEWCDERGIEYTHFYPKINQIRLANGKKMPFRRLQRHYESVIEEIERIEMETVYKKLEN